MFFPWLITWLVLEVLGYYLLRHLDRNAAKGRYPVDLDKRHLNFVIGAVVGSLFTAFLAVVIVFTWPLFLILLGFAGVGVVIAFLAHVTHNRMTTPKA